MANITGHPLYNYNLKIADDDYLLSATRYEKLAENVKECWHGFIETCKELQGVAIEGNFANKVNEYVEELGTKPGDSLYDAMILQAESTKNYIADIDTADAKLY